MPPIRSLSVSVWFLICVAATAPLAALDSSDFVSQSVTTLMNAGETVSVTVTLKNNGTSTWTKAAGYKLGTQNPQDNTLWIGSTRVHLDNGDSITPGQSKSFSFDITAPTSVGFHDFQWRMVREGVAWFGDFSANVQILVLPTAVDNADFTSQSVATTMAPGETLPVTVTVKNIGTSTWTKATGYKLGTQNPQDNTLWTGSTRVQLDNGDSIAPGQSKSFTFDITAPTNPGNYNFQWRMVHEGVAWFGDFTTNVSITVETVSQVDSSDFISQNVTTTMEPGETRSVTLTFKNNGTSTWTQAAGFKLGTQNPQDNTLWTGSNRIQLNNSDSIGPGQTKSFSFNITAPTTPGTYDFQWRMLHEGVAWFGDFTTNVQIVVESTSSLDDAQFVAQVVGLTIPTGATRSVSITFRNTGSTTWTKADGYKLSTESPSDNTLWTGSNRVALGSSEAVLPGASKTFTFDITAPSTAGTYKFQWRMIREGVQRFGELTPFLVLTVSAGGTCPAISPNDFLDDDVGLQCLLDGGGRIELAPGLLGYRIANTLNLTQNSTVLTSNEAPTKARLIAQFSLVGPMLEAISRDNFTLEHLVFDGNKDVRRGGPFTCIGYRRNGNNLRIVGGHNSTGWTLDKIESNRTLCGSALEVSAANFEISNSTFRDNGDDTRNFPTEEPWADAITLAACFGGYVHNNTITDCTDIGIISGGGANCTVTNNVISQSQLFAFGGLAVHNFPNSGAGDHTGAVYERNTISSANNKLQFGITVGMHWWFPDRHTSKGTVRYNTVSGAQVNLAIEGYSDGTVDQNTLSSPTGNYQPCREVTNTQYTAGHVTNSCLQCGWTVQGFHGSSCSTAVGPVASTCNVCK